MKHLDALKPIIVAATWEVSCYPSGTMIVAQRDRLWPHLYVYGPGGETETACVRNRFKVCEDLAAFLNGGERPAWLDDLTRVSETYAEALDHTNIMAIGPMFDSDPPNLNWKEDESWEASAARARLMDRLFLVGS